MVKRIHRVVLLSGASQLTALSPIMIRYAGHEVELQSIIDLNRWVVAHMPATTGSRPTPLSFDAPTDTEGDIKPQLEFVMFGTWLIIDGHPGLTAAPGPAADEQMVLRTVAAASALLHWRARLFSALKRNPGKGPGKSAAPKVPSIKVTAAQIRDHWDFMFDEQFDQAVFKSRLKSATRHLEGYLAHLATRPIIVVDESAVTRLPRSLHLEKVLSAMQPSRAGV
jgi:hypothetical protein